jgi:hypothetical protein
VERAAARLTLYQVTLGYALPLLGALCTAAAAQYVSSNDGIAAGAGLLGLGAGAWLAGRLSGRGPVPIPEHRTESLFRHSFRKERR